MISSLSLQMVSMKLIMISDGMEDWEVVAFGNPYTTSTTSGSICRLYRGRIISFFVGNARTGGVREIFGIDLRGC